MPCRNCRDPFHAGPITIERLFLVEQFLALFMEFLYSLSRMFDGKLAGLEGIFPTLESGLNVIKRQVGIQLTPLIPTYCGRLGVPCRQPYCDMETVPRSGLALPTDRTACPANGIFGD